ncbi:MAG: RpiB/LacA/LacB family sugar-phosphate isomerase [Candidatus Paceibacterota bacterium]
MTIYIGSDHRGFQLKKHIKNFLSEKGYEVFDVGNEVYNENDDYVDFAAKLAKNISVESDKSKGILICGSGVGVDVVANKFPNVRSALVQSTNQAYDSRNDDDTNILSLSANYINEKDAEKIVMTWIETPFSNEERHRRRIQKILDLES